MEEGLSRFRDNPGQLSGILFAPSEAPILMIPGVLLYRCARCGAVFAGAVTVADLDSAISSLLAIKRYEDHGIRAVHECGGAITGYGVGEWIGGRPDDGAGLVDVAIEPAGN